jgi:hypothetical protein
MGSASGAIQGLGVLIAVVALLRMLSNRNASSHATRNCLLVSLCGILVATASAALMPTPSEKNAEIAALATPLADSTEAPTQEPTTVVATAELTPSPEPTAEPTPSPKPTVPGFVPVGATARISQSYPEGGYPACVPTLDALTALLDAFQSHDKDTIEEAERGYLALKPGTLVRVLDSQFGWENNKARVRILSGEHEDEACWVDMDDQFNLTPSKSKDDDQPVFVNVIAPP